MQNCSPFLFIFTLATEISAKLLLSADPQLVNKCNFIHSSNNEVVFLSWEPYCLAWYNSRHRQLGQRIYKKYQAKFPQPQNLAENDGLLAYLKEKISGLKNFYLDMTDSGQTGTRSSQKLSLILFLNQTYSKVIGVIVTEIK